MLDSSCLPSNNQTGGYRNSLMLQMFFLFERDAPFHWTIDTYRREDLLIFPLHVILSRSCVEIRRGRTPWCVAMAWDIYKEICFFDTWPLAKDQQIAICTVWWPLQSDIESEMLLSRDRTVKVLNDTQEHSYEQIATSCWNTVVLTQTFDFDDVSLGSLHDFSCSCLQAIGKLCRLRRPWRFLRSNMLPLRSKQNMWSFGVLGFWDVILCVFPLRSLGAKLDQHCPSDLVKASMLQDTHNTKNFGKATTRTKVLVAN